MPKPFPGARRRFGLSLEPGQFRLAGLVAFSCPAGRVHLAECELEQEHGLDGPRGDELLVRRAEQGRLGADGHGSECEVGGKREKPGTSRVMTDN